MVKPLERRKAELQKNVKELSVQKQSVIRDIGIAVCRNPEKADSSLSDLLSRFRGLQDRLNTNSDAIEMMMRSEARIGQIQTEKKALREQRDQVQKELDPAYREVGRIAFQLYRQHPLIDSAHSVIFAELARFQDQIEAIDSKREVRAGSDSNASFLRGIVAGSRQIVLDRRRAGREQQLPKLLLNAGKAVAHGDFVKRIDDPELNRAIDPLKGTEKRLKQLDLQETKLTDELTEVTAALQTVTAGKRTARARQLQEEEIHAIQSEISATTTEIGAHVADKQIGEYQEYLDRIDSIGAAIAQSESELTQVQAGLDELVVEARIEASQRSIAVIETKAAKLEEQKSELLEEVAKLTRDKKKLARTRGNLYAIVDK